MHGLDDAERRAAYARGHHLRHQQRVRLRLPARQHEAVAAGHGAARAALRDRRRGRLDPDRRGPHAAHHLGPGGGEHPALQRRQPRHPAPRGRHQGRPDEGHRGDRDYAVDEKATSRSSPTRASRRSRSCSGSRTSTRPRSMPVRAPAEPGAEGPHPVQARRRLRGEARGDGKRGGHRRRVHRAPDARAGAGATACTRRSRPRRGSRSRARTRPSPRSPSRTTSACTRSSSGMTGTADTEAAEFAKIYNLDVMVIPTNRPMIRAGPRRRRLQDREARSSTP